MIITNKVNYNLKTAIFMFDSHGLIVMIVNQEQLVHQFSTTTTTIKNTIDIVSSPKKLGNCHY